MASSTFVAADGDGYECIMGRWSRALAVPLLEFAGIRAGDGVLDVGCGTGHLAGAVAAWTDAAEIQAIDLAPVYVDYARRLYQDPRLSFHVADACALPYGEAVFDRVLSLLVLHFVPQPQQAVTEMCRVAKPGAVVAAAVWDVRGGFVANRMFFDTAAALDERGAQRRAKNFTRPLTRPGELAQCWRAAGLADIAETVLATRMEFAGFDDYWAPYEGRDGPGAEYVGSLAAPERARLRAAVCSAYLDGEADGPRSYAALAWAVRGTVP